MSDLRRTIIFVLSAAHLGFALMLPGISIANAEDDELSQLGLPQDVGRDEVEAYCGACHSLKLVVQQGLSRADWEETIEWMVEEQEMEPLQARRTKAGAGLPIETCEH